MAYQKTPAGVAEVQNRQLGLRAELRRLLIMIDGRSPLDRYAPAFPGANVAALAAELAALGLIVDPAEASAPQAAPAAATPRPAAPATSPAPPASAASPAPPVPESRELPPPTPAQVEAARRAAVRFINDQLGPAGEAMALKLERCKTPEELRAAVLEVRANLDRFVGAGTAQRFLATVREAALNVV
ncbi:MAG: hypothetical protein N3F11_08065 [Casimicrobiaceae bacterium]|nr:hypothetical protein [Casimicrobiaceae bacterium]